MRTVAFFTTTRAEFGIISALINTIKDDPALDYKLFVGGTHLAKKYGETIKEIEKQNFKISALFDFLSQKNDAFSLSQSIGIATQQLADIFREFYFDFVCVLGDRFELLAVVTNAILYKKPIIHIHGGEITNGVIDEQIRHMVTKAAHLHFTSCKTHADNIKKMAEQKWRIYNTGALAVDNIKRVRKSSKKMLFQQLNLDITKPVALMTYHPVTLEFQLSSGQQIQNVFQALESFDLQVIATAPNMELGREDIVEGINNKIRKNKNWQYIESLGMERYLNLIPHCLFMIGNSSSGILEAPYFKVPTINIGDRQDGRIRHESVIDTDYSTESIVKAIEKSLSNDFRMGLKDMAFKFGDGNAAHKMVEIIKTVKIDQFLLRKHSELLDN